MAPSSSTVVPPLTSRDDVEASFDVIVAGCGIAGLSAAVSAHQLGARVAVLERAPIEERGGNTRYTEAFLRMKDHDHAADDFQDRLAENAGGHLDLGLVQQTLGPRDGWPGLLRSLSFTDPDLISTFAAGTGPAIRWLETFGVRFHPSDTPILSAATTRMAPSGGGRALLEALAAAAESGGVQFFYETTARSLIVEGGEVRGLRAVTKTNRERVFRGPSVVLACGGFEGNPEMLARYVGPRALYLRPVARGGNYNKGEGIQMALDIGAAPAGDYGNYHAETIDPRSTEPEASIFAFPYGILVNEEGFRFVDEGPGPIDLHYEAIARRVFEQPHGTAYCILDGKIADVPNYRATIRSDVAPIEAGDLDELAHKLHLPSAALIRTIVEFNAACQAGSFRPPKVDGLGTVGIEPPKSNWARPIDRPPYAAYPVISANVFTFGGLKIDTQARVVNLDGEVIPGLYAAGEVIGLYYRTYTSSTSVLRGAVFGRIAGRHASTRSSRAATAS